MIRKLPMLQLPLLAALTLGLAACSDEPVLEAEPFALTQAEFEALAESGKRGEDPKARRRLADELARTMGNAAVAYDRMPEQRTAIAAKVARYRWSLWERELLDRLRATAATDPAIDTMYANAQTELTYEELYLRHIYLPYDPSRPGGMEDARNDARAAYAALVEGARFEDVVRRYSQDAPTRQKGGLLGWVRLDKLPAEPAAALTAVAAGTHSEIVHDRGAFRLFHVDKRRRVVPELDRVRPELVERRYGELVEALADERAARVTRNDERLQERR